MLRAAAMYQHRASALEGANCKREWWRFYTTMPAFRRIVQSIDSAFRVGEDNDFSRVTTWGEADYGWYLLDRMQRRVEFAALKSMAVALAGQWKPSVVLVEDKASGQSLIQELQRDTRLPIRAVKVEHDNVTRAYAVMPAIGAGQVYLPEGAPWQQDFIDNMASVPNAAHDDDVDSVTQALRFMIGLGDNISLIDFYRQMSTGTGVGTRRDVTTIRLRVPENVGRTNLADGTTLIPDADGIVVAPADVAARRIRMGYRPVDAADWYGRRV